MATVSNFALRIPPSLMEEAKAQAALDDTSLNQFIVIALAEKIAAMRTRDYFMKRRNRSNPGAFLRLLAKAGTDNPPQDGDELPEGWLESGDERLKPPPA
ncbi:MAG: toxin-antitoxin system HicB family antitoxin [Magnetospirillum sp.]|nr:toxin-antitoxin system HicB family antitoxin [Magnetospirillum sp.]